MTDRGLKNLREGVMIAVKSVDMSGDDDLSEINKEIEALADGEICPQLVQYYGSGTVGRHLLLSMELMHGSLDKLKPLSEAAVAVCMREAIIGLTFLWTKYKKFHRDLKAANILYSLRGEVKLADFGCVRSLMGSTARMAQTYVGSPYWMAPEIIKNKPYNQMVDVWSLGITAMELITGKVPHSRLVPTLAMAASLEKPEPRLGTQYSANARNFVEKCLQKDPSKRKTIQGLFEMTYIKNAGRLDGWLPSKAFKAGNENKKSSSKSKSKNKNFGGKAKGGGIMFGEDLKQEKERKKYQYTAYRRSRPEIDDI